MKQKLGRKLLSFFLTLALVVGLVPGMSLTARADDWSTGTSLPTSAGSYKLTTDISISSTWTVPAGTTTLDLNGHAVTMTGDDSVITVGSGATLTLQDSSGGGLRQENNQAFCNGKER
jgi:hypothetical protein